MNRKRNRMSVFIDGGYYNAMQRYYQTDFDFLYFTEEVHKQLAAKAGLLDTVHTFYYDCEPYTDVDSTAEELEALSKRRSYFGFLRTNSVRVREGVVVKRTTESRLVTYQQKRVDLLLGLDIAEECDKGLMSHLALVAGDADLIPAVEFAGHRGVQVWLLHGPRGTYSSALWTAADGKIEVDINFVRKIAKQRNGREEG